MLKGQKKAKKKFDVCKFYKGKKWQSIYICLIDHNSNFKK